MSKKRKTKQQKIIAQLNRKLQSTQAVAHPSSHHHTEHTQTHTTHYSYTAKTPLDQKTVVHNTTTISYVRHDLRRTILLTLYIIIFQAILFYLLHSHIFVIPGITY